MSFSDFGVPFCGCRAAISVAPVAPCDAKLMRFTTKKSVLVSLQKEALKKRKMTKRKP